MFQVSGDHERWFTAVRHSTQCDVLLEWLFSLNSDGFTAAHVRDYTTAWICFAWKCNWFCCNVGCHLFKKRQRKI